MCADCLLRSPAWERRSRSHWSLGAWSESAIRRRSLERVKAIFQAVRPTEWCDMQGLKRYAGKRLLSLRIERGRDLRVGCLVEQAIDLRQRRSGRQPCLRERQRQRHGQGPGGATF